MKKIIPVLACALLLLACGKSPKTTYRLRSKSLTYLAFFGRNSWWLYGIEGKSDTFRWTAWSATLATFQSDPQYHMFTSFVGREDTHMTNDADISVVAKADYDEGGIGGIAMHFDVQANDEYITGSGNLPLENNVNVGNRIYNSVLHLHSSDTLNFHVFSDIWIAPHTGIIKMLRRDDTNVYYLKDYFITPVNN